MKLQSATALLLLCLSASMCAVLYRPTETPEEPETIEIEAPPVVDAAPIETVESAVADVPADAEAVVVEGGPGTEEEAVATDPTAAEADVQTEDVPEAVVPAAEEEPSEEQVAEEEPAADDNAAVAEEPELNTAAADEPVAAEEVPEPDVPATDVPEVDVPAAADVPEAEVPEADDPAVAETEAEVPEAEVPEALGLESDAPAATDDLAAEVPVIDVPIAEVPEEVVPVVEDPEVPEPDVPEAEVPEEDVPVVAEEEVLEADVPEPDAPDTDIPAADAKLDTEDVTDEELAQMMQALEEMEHSFGTSDDEEEETSWGFGSIRSGFEALNGYFNSLVEMVGGTDGVCQYRCHDGETPQPRPDFQMPEPDGCTNPLMGFQVYNTIDLGIPAMTKCCDLLDMCYDTCGTSKYRCDSKFRWCMHGICSDLKKSLGFVSKVQACESMADVLYKTVTTLGCNPYMNSQRAACYCPEETREEL